MTQNSRGNHWRCHWEERHLADDVTVTAVIIDLYAVRLAFFGLCVAMMLVLMMAKMRDVYRCFMLTIACGCRPA